LGTRPAPRPPAGALHLAGAYVGSVVGAGFASGQEHLRFFVSFGARGLLGVLVAGAILALLGALFLEAARRGRTRSHRELLALLVPSSLCGLSDAILSAFLFLSLAVMLAGGGALFEGLGAPAEMGALAMGACAFAIASLRPGGMLRANGVVTAALSLIIVAAGVASAPEGLAALFAGTAAPLPAYAGWVPRSWFAAAALYGVYNLTLSLALFASLGAEIEGARAAYLGGVLGGMALTLLGFGVFVAVAAAGPGAYTGELPLQAAVEGLGCGVRAAFAAALWAAMLTTAVASNYALARRVAPRVRWPHSAVSASLVVAAAPFSKVGFSHLVATVYPLAGYLGSACILACILSVALRHTRV